MYHKLESLSVPLEDVDTQPNREMQDAIGFVTGFTTPPSGRNPADVAMDFVAANTEIWGKTAFAFGKGGPPAPDPADTVITPSRVTRSPVGYHVELGQTYGNIPLYSSTAVVHMTQERSIHSLSNDLTREPPLLSIADAMQKGAGQPDVLQLVSEQLPLQERLGAPPRVELVLVPDAGQWRLAWRVDVALVPAEKIEQPSDRSGDLRAFVDVETGEVHGLLDRTLYASGEGRIFNPNPTVTLRQAGLAANTVIPSQAYHDVKLSRLDDSGFLSGRYADTCDSPDRVYHPDRLFNYDRSQGGFGEVMGYYFVDQVVDWLRLLGWPELFASPLRINAHAPLGDNSKFLPHRWAVHLGEGGVPDCEDASIIVHELGHAIQDAQVQGWGDCARHRPVRAMGEGFADFLSAVYFAEERHGFHPGLIGDWDARGFASPKAYLRSVTGAKTLDDWQGDEHQDGEIWSGALWELFMTAGGDSENSTTRKRARSTIVKLVLQSHHYLADGKRGSLTFGDGVRALLTADQFLSSDPTTPGPHEQRIRDVFGKRGIAPS